MIDRIVKKQMVQLIRKLIAKKSIYFQFNAPVALVCLKDRTLWEHFTKSVWPLYDDVYKSSLDNDGLIKKNKDLVERMTLFLYADIPYKWPIIKKRFDLFFIVAVVSLLLLFEVKAGYWGLMAVLLPLIWVAFKRLWWLFLVKKYRANLAVWPFLNQQEYDDAVNNLAIMEEQKN